METLEQVMLLHTQEVRGSSPCAPTILINALFPARCCCGERVGVIGAKSSAGIHRARVPPSHQDALLRARDDERPAAVKDIQIQRNSSGGGRLGE